MAEPYHRQQYYIERESANWAFPSHFSIGTTPVVAPSSDTLEDRWDDDTEEVEPKQFVDSKADAAEVQGAAALAVVVLLKSVRTALYVIAGLLGIAVATLIFSGRG